MMYQVAHLTPGSDNPQARSLHKDILQELDGSKEPEILEGWQLFQPTPASHSIRRRPFWALFSQGSVHKVNSRVTPEEPMDDLGDVSGHKRLAISALSSNSFMLLLFFFISSTIFSVSFILSFI